jgi:hypothetical protein
VIVLVVDWHTDVEWPKPEGRCIPRVQVQRVSTPERAYGYSKSERRDAPPFGLRDNQSPITNHQSRFPRPLLMLDHNLTEKLACLVVAEGVDGLVE